MAGGKYLIRHDPAYLVGLRSAMPNLDPLCYRGTGRDPLEAYPSTDDRVIARCRREGLDVDTNDVARWRFRELIGEHTLLMDYDENLLSTREDALEVHSLLDSPHDFEVIRVQRDRLDRDTGTLGYDIGYWPIGFSIVADCIVTPQWHPPDSNDVDEVAKELANLNENLLFNDVTDATRYRDYYRSKPWAEIEHAEGELWVVRVDSVDN